MTSETGGLLAIIVVNYGSSALLAQNLAPLSGALPDCITVVVDNRTDDAERGAIAALAARQGWLAVYPDTNLGFGSGVNVGASAAFAAGATHLLILNPDASITAEAVRSLHVRSIAAPGALYCPRIVRPDGSTWFAGSDLHLDDGRLRNPSRRGDTRFEPWPTGACLLVDRELWQTVGGFDDDYFLYWEDVDLSHRVLAAGGRLVLCDDVTAVHDEGGTHEDAAHATRRHSDTYYRYVIRNRLLFAAKHLDETGYRAWLGNARSVAWETLLQGGRRQFVRTPGVLLVGWRALREGRRLAARTRLYLNPQA
jgi:GT2 family glycosyltransferase